MRNACEHGYLFGKRTPFDWEDPDLFKFLMYRPILAIRCRIYTLIYSGCQKNVLVLKRFFLQLYTRLCRTSVFQKIIMESGIKNSFKDHQMQDVNLSRRPISVMTAVNFCELKISQNPNETLVAFSIGSGMVVSIYDLVTKAGGVLNFVLPESLTMLPEKAERHPYMFADTGLSALLEALLDSGAKTENIKVVIAGGAQIMDQRAEFNIGLKNYEAVAAFFVNNNLSIDHEDIGGISRRTLSLDIGSGCNIIQTLGQGEVQV